MKKQIILLTLLSSLFVSCEYMKYGADNLFYSGNSVLNRAKEIKTLQTGLENVEGEYSFIVITDYHFGSTHSDAPKLPDQRFFEWIENFPAETKPKFCVSLGDSADTGGDEGDNQFIEFRKFTDKVESYGIKFFNVVGNHDLYNSGWEFWKKNCYPYTSFYNFKTSDISFYALDTGTGNLGTKQMNSLKNALKNDSMPKIIMTHYPLYTDNFFFCMEDTTERNLLIKYFAENNAKMYLSGHLHWYEEVDYSSYKAYVLPSYRYKGKWALVKVNPAQNKYELKVY